MVGYDFAVLNYPCAASKLKGVKQVYKFRCLNASNVKMAAALEIFRLSIFPAIGILT